VRKERGLVKKFSQEKQFSFFFIDDLLRRRFLGASGCFTRDPYLTLNRVKKMVEEDGLSLFSFFPPCSEVIFEFWELLTVVKQKLLCGFP
jgi:hypothetical protein